MIKIFSRAALLPAIAALALAIPAQAAAMQDVPGTLDLPRDGRLFGTAEPQVYRPSARVNNQVITQTDIAQRMALLMATQQVQLSEQEMAMFRNQVFESLIDEALQVQAAAAADMEVTDEEVLERFNAVAERAGKTPREFADMLEAAGSSSISLGNQLRAQMAWDRLLQRFVQPYANVSEEEVAAILERMKADKGTAEYRVAEIYLNATPETAQATFDNAQRIIAQLKEGQQFSTLARQFSEASTASVGGDLGYVRLEQLPQELAQNIATMQPGQLAGPIEVAGGFSIVYLLDSRRLFTADARDATLSLKQISIDFAPGMDPAQLTARANSFADATRRIEGCGQADQVAAQLGASIVSRDNIALRDIPDALQNTLVDLPIGRVTQPFGTPEEGISVLVLCGREQAAEVAVPTAAAIENQILDEKIEKRARRYLRDLRRDAIISYS